MTYVGAVPTTGDFKLLDSITTSSTTTFNLRQGGVAVYPQSANHCLVVLNGVLQTAGSSFNIVNDTIVFASSLSSSDVINQILVLGNVNDIGVPSDSTVTDAKIVDMAASKLTGTVAQANIADQAINEAKMQISNAPTNGYFLSAQSGNTGGLTWAELSGTLGNFSATEFTTSTFTSVAGNSVETHDHTSNLAVGYYLVEVNTRGYATSDTSGIQVSAYNTSNHSGITMYTYSPNSSGGGQGTRTTLASRREFWNVTSATNSFRSSHGNISMWSSAHQTIPNMQGKVRVLRIA